MLVTRIIRAGELIALGGHDQELASYFDVTKFKFHGSDGSKTNFDILSSYFKSWQAAFDERSVKRGIIVYECEYLACQTWFTGKFVRDFTQSPVGLLNPNGKQVIRTVHNIFRFDHQGRIVEEWVQYDNQNYLKQLGAEKN